ncbi:MAG: hypothetical protein LQ347_006849, partial [Umbilicaria vellea]
VIYDSIEGHFCIIKCEVITLKAEAEFSTDTVIETVKDKLDSHDIISQSQITTLKKGHALKTSVKKENSTVSSRINKFINNTLTKCKMTVAENVIRDMKKEVLSSELSMTEKSMP